MKILWLSNKILSDRDTGTTGTWLDAMAQGLVDSGQIEMGNISTGCVKEVTRQDWGPVSQWIVPNGSKLNKKGLPDSKIVAMVIDIIEKFSPDLVHIWGTESYWGILSANKMIRSKTLLEMQGLKRAIAKVYSGDLSIAEQISCIGLKEIFRQSFILNGQQQFQRWGKVEEFIIGNHKFITTQSLWMDSHITALNNSSKIFHTDRILRQAFYRSELWQYSGDPVIFCTAAYSSPFKGLHNAIRAIVILKQRYPDIQLRIAGAHQRTGMRRDGYIAWICNEIKRAGIESNVVWLGALSADQLVDHLLKCSAMVLPTYIESYCLALAEAMLLGVPTVVSYTGGTSWLAKDEVSALFFPPGDEEMCAFQLERVIEDKLLSNQLSMNARMSALQRHNPQAVVMNQLEIYRQVTTDDSVP
jgi:glycosyltransferase involved in cell wall biosynthesis